MAIRDRHDRELTIPNSLHLNAERRRASSLRRRRSAIGVNQNGLRPHGSAHEEETAVTRWRARALSLFANRTARVTRSVFSSEKSWHCATAGQTSTRNKASKTARGESQRAGSRRVAFAPRRPHECVRGEV
eukprot:4726212-Pleurochrysis_carterae.AAC.2